MVVHHTPFHADLLHLGLLILLSLLWLQTDFALCVDNIMNNNLSKGTYLQTCISTVLHRISFHADLLHLGLVIQIIAVLR